MNRTISALALCASLALAGCAGFQEKLDIATSVYTTATETTVPASAVVPLANTFNILKAGATNYGRYCIAQKMIPAICSADIRRNVIRSVRAGTGARNQMEASLRNGEPALSSIYNVLVSAVNGLKATPAATEQFAGGAQ